MKICMTITLLLCLALSATAVGDELNSTAPIRPVHTYSIIAYDSATGQFGAAVQSHWFKVGDVIWAEAGVGAVATQSFVEYSYGPLGLKAIKEGKTANEALQQLLAADPQSAVRQVAMIDKNGNVAVHTGDKCIDEAGSKTGVNYSVQANLMMKYTVWGAMAKAFENTQGDLAEKMMAALEAAQKEGGDLRGMQSAAMIVVSGEPTGKPWEDKMVDIRVDDSPEPLKELRRLLNITRAYDHMDKGDEYMALEDYYNANIEYAAAAKLMPDNAEIKFWQAVTMVTAGQVDQALPIFAETYAKSGGWRVLVPRLIDAGILPNDQELIEKILAQ